MSPALSLFIIFLTVCLLSHGIQSIPTKDYKYCYNQTYTANSTYEANLNKLLNTLSSNATANKNGYFNFSITRDSTPVYGQYLCRGDVNAATCLDCVSYGVKDILNWCPMDKKAYIWYDQCSLRYSDGNFFGSGEEDPQVFYYNFINISSPERLAQFLEKTMAGEMADQAASDTSGKKFVTKEVKLTSDETLYSLVQCTPDLPVEDCSKCIKTGVNNLRPGAKGGKEFLPSCVVRYETYPFYNATSVTPWTGKDKGTRWKMAAGITVPLTVLLVAVVYIIMIKRAKKKPANGTPKNDIDSDGVEFIVSAKSLQYDLSVLKSATNDISDANKLGQGGFGCVYRGKLTNGQEIAVKRLSQSSGQGVSEFKNEVVLVAKLQHRNLVRLLGFCLAGNEKLLVYEYVPNKSLDHFLFDPKKQLQLDWITRYKIIGGIARGILYLHEDSRLRIIHRDLKPGNILMDADMLPKISDFGMARIFGIEQSQGNTSRVVGTYGYMSPEYAMRGEFSVKSDVYSFGVMLLEIISGHKINHFHQSGYADDLINYAWKKWE